MGGITDEITLEDVRKARERREFSNRIERENEYLRRVYPPEDYTEKENKWRDF